MAAFDASVREIIRRLQAVRVKMLYEQPFYAVLLMNLKFSLDEATPTLYTDGERIAFNPYFVEELSELELQFVLMHEILHVALGHCAMDDGNLDHDVFNAACDIVVNSNILYSFGMKEKYITVGGKVSFHQTPDKKEGYLFTVEEVYDFLIAAQAKASDKKANRSGKLSGGTGNEDDGDGNGDGKGNGKGKGQGKGNGSGQSDETLDDHSFWKGDGDPVERAKWVERMVDATELAERVEEVYSSKFGTNNRGITPLGAARLLKTLTEPQIDWRTILENFIQEEINDYTFTPPDRRMEDCPFFLPDFNEREERVKNVVFLVDTSGSVSDTELRSAYSEIKGAIDQFGGKMDGYIVAGDTRAYELVPFDEDTDICALIPRGGGGTDFEQPIRFVMSELENDPPSCMIYITDGYAPFPDESVTEGVPLLWLLTSEDVQPPWGKVARIKIEK